MEFKEFNMKEFEDMIYSERILINKHTAVKIVPDLDLRVSKWTRLRAYAKIRTFKRKWFDMN